MDDRSAARLTGALFITATVVGVISRVAFLQPVLGSPSVLAEVAANEARLAIGALLLLVGGASAAGIAIAMYPVLRRHAGAMALGSVGFRLIEATLYLGIVVCVLTVGALGREAATSAPAAASAYDVTTGLVLAARDALGQVSVIAFGIGATMYYWVLFRSGLIPRWLSAFGLVATASVLTSGVLVLTGLIAPMSPPQVVLALPIGVQEMVLAAWLIVKGFSPVRAPASSPQAAVGPARAAGAPAGAR